MSLLWNSSTVYWDKRKWNYSAHPCCNFSRPYGFRELCAYTTNFFSSLRYQGSTIREIFMYSLFWLFSLQWCLVKKIWGWCIPQIALSLRPLWHCCYWKKYGYVIWHSYLRNKTIKPPMASGSLSLHACYRLLLARMPKAYTRRGQSERHIPPAPIRMSRTSCTNQDATYHPHQSGCHVPPAPIRTPERSSRLSGQTRKLRFTPLHARIA